MEFPKIYQNNKVINNNQREASSYDTTTFNITNKINNMFKINQKYHKKVKIILDNSEITTTVLGITNTSLVTTNTIIKLKNIKDIIEL